MTNRIRTVELHDHSLVPAEAEVRVRVVPDHHTPPGRRSAAGSWARPAGSPPTVEVAYHLRPLPPGSPEVLWARAIIPEASSWEPECPFLYGGPVELWQDGPAL